MLCRGGCGFPESLNHVLQRCVITHDARCARHNRVVERIQRKLTKKGIETWSEMHIPIAGSYIKPDLIARKERIGLVMDVIVAGDNRQEESWSIKVAKYDTPERNAAIIERMKGMNVTIDKLIHQPIVISMRGLFHQKSEKALMSLGMTGLDISDLSMLTIKGSLKCYDTYMRGT